ncbi:MAG: hypothetical protein KDD00_16305 [Ignavibacteriae bacterium]|nr:hypothetical protein [Ignavibacteriota bacterium]
MKKSILLISILIIESILNSGQLYSQIFNTSKDSKPVVLEKLNESLLVKGTKPVSEEEKKIINKMSRLKENFKNDNREENTEKISDLQKKLTGYESIMETDQVINLIAPDANNIYSKPEHSDQLTLNEIYSSNSAYIKAIATQTEQRNPGAGTVWVVIAVGAGDVGIGASPDTLLYFNSVNNGISYSLVKRAALNTGMKINYNEMDLEIVEPFTNDKYLHIVFSVITDGFTGAHLSGIVSLRKSDLVLSGGPSFNFPGANSNISKYSKPRITSDNAKYPVEAYLTISVIQDSTDGVNNFLMTKICKIYNPYALISGGSQITYLSQSIHTPVQGYSSDAQTDVAYYNSGGTVQGDSIIFVQSGFPGSDVSVNIYKNYGNALDYPVYRGSLSGNNHHKVSAKVASNGGADQKSIYIVYVENGNIMNYYFSSLNSFKTTDGINWTYSQLAGGGDANSDVRDPDIIGRRGTEGKFYITNKWVTPRKDIISSFTIQNSVLKSFTADHNNQITASFASPKPSFRFLNNDSCLTIWPLYTSVFSSCGCKAVNISFGLIIEGHYDQAIDSAGIDLIDIHLRNPVPPFNIVSSVTGYNLSFVTFPDAVSGNYYISVNHRNSIETWYYQPVSLNDSSLMYLDFYSSQNKAFGSNQKLVDNSPLLYAIYSGDVNQDGAVNLKDVLSINNDANTFVSGYVVTDLTGNDIVDVTDVLIAYNNSANFVSVIRP